MELGANDYKVEVSARHVHLSQADFVTLFGADAELKNVKDLSIKGEFKSDKSVAIVGPKRTFERVVVLGPWRDKTQVEISLTDSYSLGVKNVPVRMSGDLKDSAPVTLVGPLGALELSEGMIVALRHIHISKSDMDKYGLLNGQNIEITVGDVRKTTFHNVVVRESNADFPVVHLDTDEGNAAF
ncbi:MAG: phosphate propanoyltransferase [Clostridia bacterium]|nr:phosphate propanoyltransferase [Clostridia bacterium]